MAFTSKHFVNENPSTLVIDALKALAASNPQLSIDEKHKVVYVKQRNKSLVALISGGGSGHEPAHSGFVGDGVLSAAVCGSVFASPNAIQVKKAIELVDGENGTLIIVKNYTGDVLNFGLAKEQYQALHPDKADRVKFLIVGDDVSVGKTKGDIVGRRGLAGTVLVYKIAGALAREGADLNEVYTLASNVASRTGTVGVGLEHCHVPGSEPQRSHLKAEEIEIGMGIHNEPGHARVTPIPPLQTLISRLLDLLTSTTDPERSYLPFEHDGSDRVVLLVNNLGGLSELELNAIAGEALKGLGERKIGVERLIVGTFMTSLNMPGFSVTLLLLPRTSERETVLRLLDVRTETPGWKWSSPSPPNPNSTSGDLASSFDEVLSANEPKLEAEDPPVFVRAIERACRALVQAEPEITRLDTVAGDGDCGTTLKAGAQGVLNGIENQRVVGTDVIGSLLSIAKVAEEQMGGTSGALYSIFFSGLAQAVRTSSQSGKISVQAWTQSVSSSLEKLYTYTRARPPSRTLIDPLSAFVLALEAKKSFDEAVAEAVKAKDATKEMEAKAGRAAYVQGENIKGEVDPGAYGVVCVLEALRDVYYQ